MRLEDELPTKMVIFEFELVEKGERALCLLIIPWKIQLAENSIACLTIHICLDQNRKINMERDKPSFTV